MAHNTREPRDIAFARNIYKEVLPHTMAYVCKGAPYMNFARSKQRGKMMDRYVLQQLVGSDISRFLEDRACLEERKKTPIHFSTGEVMTKDLL